MGVRGACGREVIHIYSLLYVVPKTCVNGLFSLNLSLKWGEGTARARERFNYLRK